MKPSYWYACVSSLALGLLASQGVYAAAELDPKVTNGGSSGVFEGLPITLAELSENMMTNTPLLTDMSAFHIDGLVLAEPSMGNTNTTTLGHIIDVSGQLGYGTYAIYDRLVYYTTVILLPGYSSDGRLANGSLDFYPTTASPLITGILGGDANGADPTGGDDPFVIPVPEPGSLMALMTGAGMLMVRRRKETI